MFRWAIFAMITLVLVACNQDVTSAETQTSVNTIGTIREIDKEARRMVLRIEGRTLTLQIPDSMVNFDLLEQGDRVRVEYEEATAVRMALPDEQDVLISEGITVVPPEGNLPGRVSADGFVVSAEFLEYDNDAKRVWLLLSDGTYLSAFVPRQLRSFARARVPGDQILIGSSRVTVVSVEPAE